MRLEKSPEPARKKPNHLQLSQLFIHINFRCLFDGISFGHLKGKNQKNTLRLSLLGEAVLLNLLSDKTNKLINIFHISSPGSSSLCI